MASATPSLTLQTASLYASGAGDTFSGSGGPYGFSPFTGQFGGYITSAGLASEPFSDAVFGVSVGDEITFVIAVQDMTAATPAYNVAVSDIIPAGFVIPPDGIGLTVTDGNNNDLSTSGNLFSTAGLVINSPLAGYDPNSGKNIALITYSLDAGSTLPGPFAILPTTATLAAYSATPTGSNLSAGNSASATTNIITAAPIAVVTAETDPSAVAIGQTVAFDVVVTVPAGTLSNFTIAPQLPSGSASLQLVSSSVASIGSALQTGMPKVAADGTISFGNVTLAPGVSGDSTISARIVLRAEGSASGQAIFQTNITSGNATSGNGLFTAAVSTAVGVVVPPPPPALSGLSGAQTAILSSAVTPFAHLAITDSSSATGTIAITPLDPALGTLSDAVGGTVDPAGRTFSASGSLATLMADAQKLTFTPTATGAAAFTITVIDGVGGTVQDSSTTVAINANGITPDPLFNVAYYLAHNPDVAAAGVNPLQHFEQYGWREGRNPSASFDVADYLAANPDVKAAGVDPLLQYDLYGQHEGRAEYAVPAAPPNALVDPAYYYAANTDVRAAGVDASTHYLANGWLEGRNPDAWFDTNYYLAQNPDVKAAGIDPLLHFELYGWKEGRDPSLLFSDAKYLAANRDVAAAGVDPLQQFVQFGQAEGRIAFLTGGTASADPLVNATFYDAQLGATLIPAGQAGAGQAAWSYATSGWQHRLNPDAFFDTKYYLAHNPDVAAAGVNPLLHFEQYGWKEGRDPSAAFSTHKYLAAYADVRAAGVDPLLQYITAGMAEGRQAFAV